MKKIALIFALLCLAAIVFHKQLLLVGCKVALHRLDKNSSYEKMQWEDSSIVISGLTIQQPGMDVTVDRIELDLLHVQPKIAVVHPQILLSAFPEQGSSPVPLLFRTQLSINNGVLQLPTGGRFYFTMAPIEKNESHLVISSDPDPLVPPMLSANVAHDGEKLHVGFQLQESDLSRLLPLTSLIFKEKIPREWEQAGGEVQWEGVVNLDRHGKLRELHCKGEGKQIILKSKDVDLACEEIEGTFSYPESQASLFLKNGKCLIGDNFQIDHLEGGFELEPNKEAELSLTGHWKEVPFECAGSGKNLRAHWGSFDATLEWSGSKAIGKISGDAEELIALFSDQMIQTLPLQLDIEASLDGRDLHLKTVATLASEVIDADILFSQFHFKEACLHAAHVTPKSYADLAALLIPDIKLMGNLQCDATISPSEIHMQMHSDDLCIEHPLAELHLPQSSLRFSYDIKAAKWSGEIPLHAAKLCDRQNDLLFDNVEGSMVLDACHLIAPAFYAECEGVALRGKMDLCFEKSELSLSTMQMEGNVQQLLNIVHHFPSLSTIQMPMEGSFSGTDQGFVLRTPLGTEGHAEWCFKAHFHGLHIPVNEATEINDAECMLLFDSKRQELLIEKGEGKWQLMDGAELIVQLNRYSRGPSGADVVFKVNDSKREIAHFEAKGARNDKAEWVIAFDPQKTHFGGILLNIKQCSLSEQLKLSAFEMRPTLKGQELHAQAAFLQNAGFLTKSFSAKNLQEWQFEGTLQTRLYSEKAEEGFSFFAESRDLKVRGQPWPAFQLKAHKIGENWLIEHLEGGGLTLKGTLLVDGDDVNLLKGEGAWHGIQYKANAQVKMAQKTFSCRFESVKGNLPTQTWKGNFLANGMISGDFSLQLMGEANLFVDLQTPLAMTGKNKKLIQFTYDKTLGLIGNRIDLQFKDKVSGNYIAEVQAAKLLWPPQGKFSLEKLEFSLSHKIKDQILPAVLKELSWEGNLEGSGDFQDSIFQAALKPGRYGFGTIDLPFEQLQVRYEKNLISMRGKTQLGEKPLWGSLQVDVSKEPFGALKLFDHPKAEGMKILFTTTSGKAAWETVQGSCYGLECHLTKSKKIQSMLSGQIKLDTAAFLPLLPKELKENLSPFKIGKGYEYNGDLIVGSKFEAKGTLTANDFELLGYRFHRLQANLEAAPDRIFLTELKMEDPALALSIKKIELNKQDKWRLHIPHLFLRHLQPSMMHKIDGDPQLVKPFAIKNFSLSEVRATLGDKASLEASGKLSFVNQCKKESSFLDVPFEMIKNIGLDPNLLTPVHGELEIELRGDKFYLMSLKNSFSEGERTEFYLAPTKELSYIDLDGKIHIDLKMHQDVMIKLTEPFTLTIRGTLERPRYGLQY